MINFSEAFGVCPFRWSNSPPPCQNVAQMPHSKVGFGGQMPHPLGDLRSSEMISVFQGIALQAVLAFLKALKFVSENENQFWE